MVTEDDYEDAIGLIDLVDNPIAARAVLDALAEVFQGIDKKKLWERLTPHQKHKLKFPDSLMTVAA